MSAFGRKNGVGGMSPGARPSFGVAKPMKGGGAMPAPRAPTPGGEQFPPLPAELDAVAPAPEANGGPNRGDAMSRLGGSWWRKWAPPLKKALLDSQNKKGDAEGSWPTAQDSWARNAGAVYHCAMNALSLENFFEHRE